MPNNTLENNAAGGDDLRVIRARNRIAALYARLGTWRAVQEHLGLPNPRYAWAFVRLGRIPPPPYRRAMGLPLHLDKPPRRNQPPWAAYPDWMQWWRALGKAERRAYIQTLFELNCSKKE